jgi:hypothetical protein
MANTIADTMANAMIAAMTEAAAPAGRTGAIVGVAELLGASSPVVRGSVKSRCVASIAPSMRIAG